jgi:hypothetical protein
VTESDEWLREMIDVGRNPEPLKQPPERPGWGWRFHSSAAIGALPRRGMRMLMTREATQRLEGLPKKVQGALTEAWTKNGWTLYSIGASDAGDFDFKAVASALDAKAYGQAVIAQCCLSEGASATPSPIGAEWMRLLGQAEIPFDRSARRRQLKHAFDKLRSYVRAHEQTSREP